MNWYNPSGWLSFSGVRLSGPHLPGAGLRDAGGAAGRAPGVRF